MLRSEVNSRGEYNPRAYQVFGPKIGAWALSLNLMTQVCESMKFVLLYAGK